MVPLFAYKIGVRDDRRREKPTPLSICVISSLRTSRNFRGSRVVPGALGRNDMAIGVAKERPAAAAYVEVVHRGDGEVGLVTKSIEKVGVRGAVRRR